MIRWFQYATFCPLLRMHGHRKPHHGDGAGHSGGPNELWSYGDEAYAVMRSYLDLRTRLTRTCSSRWIRHSHRHPADAAAVPGVLADPIA
jgi:hypothetical protein